MRWAKLQSFTEYIKFVHDVVCQKLSELKPSATWWCGGWDYKLTKNGKHAKLYHNFNWPWLCGAKIKHLQIEWKKAREMTDTTK